MEPQPEEADLSKKLFTLARRCVGACLFTGGDCSTVPLASFIQAAELLGAGVETVLCPTEDGGTCILGAQSECVEWYLDVPWSSGIEREVLESRAHERDWRVEQLPRWHDLDRIEDLSRTVAELRGCAERGELAAAGKPGAPPRKPGAPSRRWSGESLCADLDYLDALVSRTRARAVSADPGGNAGPRQNARQERDA